MNAAPKICRACGGVINNPEDGKTYCDDCWHLPETPRPDDSDLTKKLWRLRQQESSQMAWTIFRSFATVCVGMILYWLIKQLL